MMFLRSITPTRPIYSPRSWQESEEEINHICTLQQQGSLVKICVYSMCVCVCVSAEHHSVSTYPHIHSHKHLLQAVSQLKHHYHQSWSLTQCPLQEAELITSPIISALHQIINDSKWMLSITDLQQQVLSTRCDWWWAVNAINKRGATGVNTWLLVIFRLEWHNSKALTHLREFRARLFLSTCLLPAL